MDFSLSAKTSQYAAKLQAFMDSDVFPSEMTEELPKDMESMIKMFTPAGRLGDPEELAATLIWLVSDASSYVTGITVPVDGGLVMP